jgi:hypothetical protein
VQEDLGGLRPPHSIFTLADLMTSDCDVGPPLQFSALAEGGRSRYHSFHGATTLEHMAFGGLTVSPCCETMSLQISLIGRDRLLIPFEANPRHIGNVKQSVTNFIWLL